MDFFRDVTVALRGPTGATQTAADTISKLTDRLSPATLLADRRAAVLSLKGLSRDCKKEVGDRALSGLLEVLANDAELDSDIGKAVLETLNTLCDVDDNTPDAKDLGFKYTDGVLANEKATHTLFALLGDTSFYTRFATIRFLSTLLEQRRQVIQGYFLTAPVGATTLISVLEDKREIIRNECLTMLQSLISHNPDIQKIVAFEGGFERLFNILTEEGGLEGGAVAHATLICIDGLLRFNMSNQSYFRETAFYHAVSSLIQFPPSLELHDSVPQEFALQFWDQHKMANTSSVLGIMGILAGSKGSNIPESSIFIRCFLETALASNFPTPLKTQALRLLPPNLTFPLSELLLTPYLPVPESNGEEWDRLEQTSALDALVEIVLHGEYNGIDGGKRSKDDLELRCAALIVFENFVRKEEIKQAIVQAMLPIEGSDASDKATITPLLQALIAQPAAPLDPIAAISTHLATLLFSHLLRSSPRAKTLARSIVPPAGVDSGSFFVPADGPPPEEMKEKVEESDEPPQTLLQILTENLSLSLLSRSRADSSERESRHRDQLIAGYLSLLSQWLWDDSAAVRDFLDAGGLGVLVEPINQRSHEDALVPGLCVFLLGVCYEFNHAPGEITRATISPILDRLGIDTLIGRTARVREDERFKSIGPDSMVLSHTTPMHRHPVSKAEKPESEAEIWFDWAFVDFWKSNYYTVQRGFSTDPDSLSSPSGRNDEMTMLVASLREVIARQSSEIENLESKLANNSTEGKQLAALRQQVESLTSELKASEEKRKEMDKEQEDLLVLLDEMTSKRRRDKARLQEVGLAVSEDEADDQDE